MSLPLSLTTHFKALQAHLLEEGLLRLAHPTLQLLHEGACLFRQSATDFLLFELLLFRLFDIDLLFLGVLSFIFLFLFLLITFAGIPIFTFTFLLTSHTGHTGHLVENLKEQIVELAAHLGENQLVRADEALQAAQVELYRAPFDGSGGGGGGGGKRGRWLNSGGNVGGSFRSLGKSFKRKLQDSLTRWQRFDSQ
ncbi:hypothetical protein TYRP_022378 [Tyrophagus putrescentiae]|nr:hypothetical protein TYRP_022378 [Tyrophagus putrescentiae]